MRALTSVAIATVTLAMVAGCPGKHVANPSPELTADGMVEKLAASRALATSFRAESVMDYWLGDQRVKGTVKVMGTPASQVRFNALSPTDDVIADLACDGNGFVYVDRRNNCVLTGPCNQDSIAQLLRVALAPEDFFYLAIGQTPILAGSKATMTWDGKKGYQRLELSSATGSQSVVLDGNSPNFDVLRSELRTPSGEVVWSVTNVDFAELADAAGTTLRVPSKTRFQSPDDKADLIVDWKTRELNVTLDSSRFVLQPPEGLPACPGQR